ncbi:glucose-methanol-choline oxidoreductase, putative [Bodo saltans]|uniref:Glucose-methanol-choline oxidoreductase, putative n=1 Tax=Bodo saltans TaxID=75058 RepID=A0A0S4JLN1_BODSA|nr:glucose-methanol-choline oxidoreductase, putative [Bodo saltans]|eukprot:CUG90014.1 glucose-methanol-choline oxidoreductase, putative [Bodo saltans]
MSRPPVSSSLFDVIVVGAGSAGIGVCYNLAMKYPSIKILLLERGSSAVAPTASRTPLLSLYSSWFSSKLKPFQRQYTTVAEEALNNRTLGITRGMGFGGSSLLDDMQYLRGPQSDVASWNSKTWTWDVLTDTLRRVQRNSRDNKLMHGDHGPLAVTDASCALTNSNLNVRFFQACEAAGMPSSVDFNDGVCDGQGTAQSFINRGARVDVFDAMMMENKHRTKNLDVRSSKNVAKLLMSDSRECLGVVLDDGEEIRSGRVIVCGGAIETPALLMRSGIGNSDALKAAGVPPIVHNEGVGANLIANPSVDFTFRLENEYATELTRPRSFNFLNVPVMYKQWKEYMDEGTGFFSSPHEAMAFVRSENGLLTPNLSIQFICAPLLEQGRKWANFPGYTARVALHRPKSRGSVSLTSNGSVAVATGMYSEMEDIKAMDEGLMWVGLLCSADSSLQSGYYQLPTTELSFDAPFNGLKPILAQPKEVVGTAKAAEALLRSTSFVGQSLFGTCAMGTVVNDTLQVNGVSNGSLLVADSSVVPTTTLGNSRTWNLSIGLRCADLL